jgi:hypothetical protein
MKCVVDGCENEARARRMCKCHYMKWWHSEGKSEPRLRSPAGTGSGSWRGYIYHREGGAYVGEHRKIAEKALGKPLPPGAVVHHVNEKPWDNRPENLVICPSQEYHKLLHKRMKDLGITFDESD